MNPGIYIVSQKDDEMKGMSGRAPFERVTGGRRGAATNVIPDFYFTGGTYIDIT